MKKKRKQINLGGPAFGFAHQKMQDSIKYNANLQLAFIVAVINRRGKKVCRKCYCRLPLNAKVCSKCHNPDIRYKKKPVYSSQGIFKCYADDKTKNKLINRFENK